MPKIHVFAIRYREDIGNFIKNFYSDSTLDKTETKLTIINNYGELTLEDSLLDYTIINNLLRPDFSTGHLSRNWNQALINGFKSLNNPDVDYVIGVQIDSILKDSWYKNLVTLLNNNPNLEYLCLGAGDEFQVFTPAIIKKVGLYDERFCNIGYQEADYFRRLLNLNSPNVIICDYFHGRVFNKLNISTDGIILYNSYKVANSDHQKSMEHHHVSRKMFSYKWGELSPENWSLSEPTSDTINPKEFRFYPYFEKDIDPGIYIV